MYGNVEISMPAFSADGVLSLVDIVSSEANWQLFALTEDILCIPSWLVGQWFEQLAADRLLESP